MPGLPHRRRRADTALAYAMLCVVMALWAGNSIVGRAVRDAIPPLTLAFVRWAGALRLVGPFALQGVAAEGAALRRHWRVVLLLGLVGVAAFNGLLYSGLRSTTATSGLLLQATVPALVLLFMSAPSLRVRQVQQSTLRNGRNFQRPAAASRSTSASVSVRRNATRSSMSRSSSRGRPSGRGAKGISWSTLARSAAGRSS
jgi:hypothetical protein